MSKTRKLAKQELTRVNGNIDWCFNHIKTFLDLGYAQREEFLKPIQAVVMTLDSVKDTIESIKNKL